MKKSLLLAVGMVAFCWTGASAQCHNGTSSVGVRPERPAAVVPIRIKGDVIKWNLGREFHLYGRDQQLVEHDHSSYIETKVLPQGTYHLDVGCSSYKVVKDAEGLHVSGTL